MLKPFLSEQSKSTSPARFAWHSAFFRKQQRCQIAAASVEPQQFSTGQLAAAIALAVTALWSFWPILRQMASRWNSDPQYSHGFLVPVLAALIAWQRREDVTTTDIRPAVKGLPFIFVGLAGLLFGAHISFDWLQQTSLLPILCGIAFVAGGRRLFSITWPAVMFLLFMIPLPFRIEVAMAQPLQKLAGIASTFCLQTAGLTAIRQGNLINVEGHVLGVAEACSGLRMLVVFFAMATAFAVFIQRSWLHKLILLTSAAPIALICNVGRITITGMLYVYAGPELAERLFHDLAGWLMMPAALTLLFLELKYLSVLIDDSGTPLASGSEDTAGIYGLSV